MRNEKADDFLCLLREWEKLCKEFRLVDSDMEDSDFEENNLGCDEDKDHDDESPVSSGEYEVEKLLSICYGDPNEIEKTGLYFEVFSSTRIVEWPLNLNLCDCLLSQILLPYLLDFHIRFL